MLSPLMIMLRCRFRHFHADFYTPLRLPLIFFAAISPLDTPLAFFFSRFDDAISLIYFDTYATLLISFSTLPLRLPMMIHYFRPHASC